MDLLKRFFNKSSNKFLSKYYSIFLALVVLVSFGQILWMQPWQDDQALFFKLAHLEDPAGYFGAGPLGSGVYRFAAVPFIPVYYFFKHNTSAYFGLLLVLYILTTLVIYKTFSALINEKMGKVTSFLYACGYITSDSFWRMANSAVTSISIILTCTIIFFYFRFYQSRRILWYILAVLFYFIAVQVSLARIHYFIGVVVSFELLFLAFKKFPKSFVGSAVRILPFIYIFATQLLGGADQRTGGVKDLLSEIFHGKFYLTYGFFGSLANLIVPDWLLKYFYQFHEKINTFMGIDLIWFNVLLVPTAFSFFLVRKSSHKKLLLLLAFLAFLIWGIISHSIFNSPILSLGRKEYLIAIWGGVILIFLGLIFFSLEKNKKIYVLFLIWLLSNIAAYWAYFPTFAYDSINRYLAHSFLAWTGVFGLFFISLPKTRTIGKAGMILIILLGIGNLYQGVILQSNILVNRSYPTKHFFNQLKSYVPEVKKGDIFYVDVASVTKSQVLYGDIISAAMMPNTTSLAWRYGVDRYDIKLTESFDEFLKIAIEDKTQPENIHTFFFTSEKLVDTSKEIRSYLLRNLPAQQLRFDLPQNSVYKTNYLSEKSTYIQPVLIVNFLEPIKSMIPIKLKLEITAQPFENPDSKFPLFSETKDLSRELQPLWQDPQFRALSFQYKGEVEDFYKQAKVATSSQWMDRVTKNILDLEPDTVWQSDRTLWGKEKTFIQFELSEIEEVSKLFWTNGFPNSTPTDYSIDVSMDGEKWQVVKRTNSVRKVEKLDLQLETFNPVFAKFVRVNIFSTLDGDAPAVAEMWVVSSKYERQEIDKILEFLDQPFAIIPSFPNFLENLSLMENLGSLKVYWLNDKTPLWQSSSKSKLEVIYDGNPHEYTIEIPPGGTGIAQLRLSDFTIPGKIILSDIKSEYFYP